MSKYLGRKSRPEEGMTAATATLNRQSHMRHAYVNLFSADSDSGRVPVSPQYASRKNLVNTADANAAERSSNQSDRLQQGAVTTQRPCPEHAA